MKTQLITGLLIITFTHALYAETNLKFDWGNDKAIVTETIYKNNSSIKFSYQVRVKKAKGGFVLQQKKIKALEFKGNKISEPSIKNMVENLAKLPSLKVDKNGELLEVINQEKYIENFVNALPDPNAKDFYKNPQMQNILIMKAYEKWCYWVCNWTEENLSENNPHVESENVEFMGSTLPQRSVYKHHGFSPEFPDNVKLTFVSVTGIVDPTEFLNNVSEYMNIEINDKNEDEELTNVSKIMNIEAIVEPKTLKPSKIIVKTKMTVNSLQESQSREEKHIYEFKWK